MTDDTTRPAKDVAADHGVDDHVQPEDEAAADRAFADPELSGDHEEVAEIGRASCRERVLRLV